MSDCDHCRNHWCCELEYKDKVEHCFFENPTDEYNATFTQEYKYGYEQGRADQRKEDEELNYHYQTSHECYMQGRADAIEELVSKLKGYMESTECSTYIDELNNDNGTYSAMPIYDYVDDLAEQLKEKSK